MTPRWTDFTAILRVRAVRDTGWTFLLQALHAGLGFLTTVMLARFLGSSGYGLYSFAFAVVMLLALPARAGLPNLVLRETARGIARDTPGHVRSLWRWAARYTAAASVVIGLLLGPLLVWWQWSKSPEAAWTFAVALFLVPAATLGALVSSALQGLKRITAGQLPDQIAAPLVLIGLVGGTVLIAPNFLSPVSTMLFRVTASMVAFGLGSWMLKVWTPRSLRAASPDRTTRGFARAASYFTLLAGLQFILGQADVIILGIFKPSDQVGIYRVAFQLATLAVFGLLVVNVVLAPRFAALAARSEVAKLQRLARLGARAALASSVLLSGVFLVAGKWILGTFFGEEFAASYTPMAVLLFGQLVNSAAGSVGLLLNMSGRERDTAAIVAVAALLNVGLNLGLVPAFGVTGAAIATAVSTVLWNGLMWRSVKRNLGLNALAFGRTLTPNSD